MTLALALLHAASAAGCPPGMSVCWPAGGDIAPATFVDVTPEGFASIEGIAAAVLPPTFPIDPSLIEQSDSIDILVGDIDYGFTAENMYLLPTLLDLSVTPVTDALSVHLDMRVSLSAPSDPGVLHIDADGSILGIFSFPLVDEDCSFHVDDVPIRLDAVLRLTKLADRRGTLILDANGHIQLDASFESLSFPIPALELEDLHLGNAASGSCAIDDILEFADWIGIDAVEIIMQELEPTINAQVEQLTADLATTIEETWPQLTIEQSLDLLGAPLDVSAWPEDFYIVDDGLRLELGGRFSSGDAPHPCVSRFDSGFSLATLPISDPRHPGLGATPPGATPGLDALVNDDWLNQATYAVWRAGLLCQEISDGNSPIDLPIPINTSLLSLMAAGQFNELFPTSAPLVLKTRPESPPVASVRGEHAADVTIDKLGVDFVAELDGRLSRVVGLDLAADVGLDLAFDANTGVLGVDVAFDPSDIEAAVSFNDLVPEVNAAVENGFSTIADQLVGPLLDTALGDISFPIPAIQGLGLTSAHIGAIGASHPEDPTWLPDYLGVYGAIGAVPYGDPTGGCDSLDLSSGCSGTSCSTGGPAP
ncbi:MAG TPA: hypothetical protein PKA64_23310, partial [Myxococcota bacterium]|nr:hypothetical protein [Myxococcota bacterium]